jgi:hypothetical protein
MRGSDARAVGDMTVIPLHALRISHEETVASV